MPSANRTRTSLAQLGLRFVDLDPDARLALSALAGAEAGCYRAKTTPDHLKPQALFSGADRAMAKRGWDRLLALSERDRQVVVHVPKDLSTARI